MQTLLQSIYILTQYVTYYYYGLIAVIKKAIITNITLKWHLSFMNHCVEKLILDIFESMDLKLKKINYSSLDYVTSESIQIQKSYLVLFHTLKTHLLRVYFL